MSLYLTVMNTPSRISTPCVSRAPCDFFCKQLQSKFVSHKHLSNCINWNCQNTRAFSVQLNIYCGMGILTMPYAMRMSGWAGLGALTAATAVFCLSGKLLIAAFDCLAPGSPHTFPALGAPPLSSESCLFSLTWYLSLKCCLRMFQCGVSMQKHPFMRDIIYVHAWNAFLLLLCVYSIRNVEWFAVMCGKYILMPNRKFQSSFSCSTSDEIPKHQPDRHAGAGPKGEVRCGRCGGGRILWWGLLSLLQSILALTWS